MSHVRRLAGVYHNEALTRPAGQQRPSSVTARHSQAAALARQGCFMAEKVTNREERHYALDDRAQARPRRRRDHEYK